MLVVDDVVLTENQFKGETRWPAQSSALIQNFLEAAGFHLFAASGADCGVLSCSSSFGRDLRRCVVKNKTTQCNERKSEWPQGRMTKQP